MLPASRQRKCMYWSNKGHLSLTCGRRHVGKSVNNNSLFKLLLTYLLHTLRKGTFSWCFWRRQRKFTLFLFPSTENWIPLQQVIVLPTLECVEKDSKRRREMVSNATRRECPFPNVHYANDITVSGTCGSPDAQLNAGRSVFSMWRRASFPQCI